MKKQEYLLTLINLHIYNQPFITSKLAINMLIIFLFLIIFIYTLIKKKVKRMYSFISYQLTCKTSRL